MGLENAPQAQLGRIDPSSLIGAATPVVEPRATAALADAFRQGTITAHDVLDRVGEVAQSRKKVELALHQRQLTELQDPQLAEARRNAMLATGAQAQLLGAQAGAALPMVGQQAQLTQSQLDEAQAAQKYGPAIQYYKALAPEAGLTAPPVDQEGKPDYAKMAEVGSKLFSWKIQKQTAMDRIQPHEYKEGVQGNQKVLLKFNKSGELITPELESQLHKQATAPFAGAPGSVEVAPRSAAPSVTAMKPDIEMHGTPETIAAQRADLINSGTPGADSMSDSAVESMVQSNRAQEFNKPTIQAPPAPSATGSFPVATSVPNAGLSLGAAEKTPEISTLTDQVRKQKSYESWNASKPFYNSMREVMADVNKIPIEEQRSGRVNMGIKDIELVSNFIKLYDPNAVIREFKWDKIEHSQPIPDRVKNWMSEITRAGSMTPETRQELFHVASQAYDAKAKSVLPDLKLAEKRATQYGHPIDQVLNPDELDLLHGTFKTGAESMAPSPGSAGASQSGPEWGPVVELSGVGKVRRGPDGQYHRAQ